MTMENEMEILDQLLYEEASDCLIFRPHEYKFDGALLLEKGELLKDIVSAANAWRRADTYILVGVEWTNGGKNKILGVINHLDENEIREFINGKLQEPLLFHYQALTVDRKKIGVIHIPLQKRPFYLTEDFANLKKYVIYIRRGDSVREAGTEEAARIKESLTEKTEEAASADSVRVEFAYSPNRKVLGDYLKINTYSIEIPDPGDLPDFPLHDSALSRGDSPESGVIERPNRHFYRELAVHLQKAGSVGRLDFCVSNQGPDSIHDVRLDISIEDPDRECFCLEEFEIPSHPLQYIGPSNQIPLVSPVSDQVRVKRRSPFWSIQLFFREVLPENRVFSDAGLYIGAESSVKLELVGLLTARELSSPLHVPLIVEIETQKMNLDKTVICKSG
jgi:hypothetical protein